jgi:ribosome-associated heat shock protein Hsp15
MRLDDFLSTVGVVKRRSMAKKLADAGMIEVNGNSAKPACQVRIGDIILIKGTQSRTVEVLQLPAASVSKTDRERYFKSLSP